MPIDTSTGAPGGTEVKKSGLILKDGCYLIRYTQIDPSPDILFYEGTVRVLRIGKDGQPDPSGEIQAGGDLYCRLRDFRYGRDLTQWPKEARSSNQTDWPDPTVVPVLVKKDKTTGADNGVIPIFPRRDYRYYLEVIKILGDVPAEGSVTVRFNVHAFQQNEKWPNPGTRSVALTQTTPPADGPDYPTEPTTGKPLCFAGNLLDEESGQIVGTISMGWISPYLRRATVEIDHVEGVQSPGKKDDWGKAFAEAKWQIEIDMNASPIAKPADGGVIWTIGELHQALYKLRIERTTDPKVLKKARDRLGKTVQEMSLSEIRDYILANPAQLDLLDKEWYYHLLCVPRIDGFDRGVMFDTYGADSDNVPREGAAVAAQWDFKEEDQALQDRWSNIKVDQLQKEKPVYLRVAVHEIGHAMGLDHNHKDNGFMNTTDAIADNGLEAVKKAEEAQITAAAARIQATTIANDAAAPSTSASVGTTVEAKSLGKAAEKRAKTLEETAKALSAKGRPFPENILLAFHPEDLHRLRFGPDITVRPGTTFDDYGPLSGDSKLTRAEGLELEVSPLLEAVPFGAPVRIQLKLKNTSDKDQMVPKSLSLKSGVVDGRVSDPDGNERTFWPLKKSLDGDEYATLAPDGSSGHAVTLLRGAQMALFPMAGDHRVKVTATWENAGGKMFVENETVVHVTPPVDESHRAAALKVISTPDTLLSLAIGGDHLTEGNAAIRAALANPILKPHFAIIEARRLLTSNPGQKNPETANLRTYDACRLIDEGTVLSFDEIERIYELIAEGPNAAKTKKAAEIDATLMAELKRVSGVLLNMTDKLLRQDAADTDRAGTLKGKISNP